MKYDFECTDFALSAEGVHLLRNRYPYQTIAYPQIDKARIKRGTEIKNPLLSLLLGAALLLFSALKSISLYGDFHNPDMRRIYIESILLPLFPALVGSYFIYAAFRRGPVLDLEAGKKGHRLRLRELQKRNQLQHLQGYLDEKLSLRFLVEEGPQKKG